MQAIKSTLRSPLARLAGYRFAADRNANWMGTSVALCMCVKNLGIRSTRVSDVELQVEVSEGGHDE